jgi:O-antigen ligase/tetratricopeptide (TPR) repeat protein
MGKTARMKREKSTVSQEAQKKRAETAPPRQNLDGLTILEDALFCLFFFSLALLFTTSIQVHFTLPKLIALRICTLFMLLLWIYRLMKGHVKNLPKPVLYTGLALGLWWIFSSFFALHTYTALHGVYGRYNALYNHEIYLLLFFMIASMPMDMERIKRMLRFFIFALVPVSLYAVLQYHRIDPIPWPGGRSASTIGNPVILGGVLGLAAPFILTFFIQSLRKDLRHWSSYLWGGLFLLFAYATFTTLSRGPWWGMIFSTATVVVVNTINRSIDRKKLYASLIVFAVFGLVVFSSNYSHVKRVTDSVKLYMSKKTDTPLATRLIYWEAAIKGIADHPVAGIGFEGFRIIYPSYRPVEDNVYFKDVIPTMVHNGYLQTALTNGIPALALYLTLLTLIMALLIKTYKKAAETEGDMRFLCTAFIASIVSYLVDDVFGWLEIAISPFYWTILALGVSLCVNDYRKEPLAGWKKNMGYGLGFLCAAGLLVLSYDAANRAYGDRLFWKSQTMNAVGEWPQIESNIAEGLASVPGDFFYEDMAGLLYLKRFNFTGDPKSYRQGVEVLEKAHRHNPFDVYVLLHRVDLEMVALRKGIIKDPSPFVEKAVRDLILMDRNNPTVYEAVARLKLAERKYTDALEFIKKAGALKPTETKYLLFESDIYRALNDVDKASATYQKVVSKLEKEIPLPPDWASAKLGLVYTLVTKNDLNGALKEVNTLIDGFPTMPDAYVARGDIYGALGNLEKSKESFGIALKIDPRNPYARAGLEQLERLLPKTAGK